MYSILVLFVVDTISMHLTFIVFTVVSLALCLKAAKQTHCLRTWYSSDMSIQTMQKQKGQKERFEVVPDAQLSSNSK